MKSSGEDIKMRRSAFPFQNNVFCSFFSLLLSSRATQGKAAVRPLLTALAFTRNPPPLQLTYLCCCNVAFFLLSLSLPPTGYDALQSSHLGSMCVCVCVWVFVTLRLPSSGYEN